MACVLLAVGQIFMGASTNYAWLMLGRVICGSGIGITFVVAPIYISEISPADIRGSMGALVRLLFIVFGEISANPRSSL